MPSWYVQITKCALSWREKHSLHRHMDLRATFNKHWFLKKRRKIRSCHLRSVRKVPVSTDTNTPNRPTGVASVIQLGIEFNSPVDQQQLLGQSRPRRAH